MAWNGWYHLTAHTYGSWVQGDLRGWRERHHRRHVEGDYKNPPPREQALPLMRRSQSQMSQPAVFLNHHERKRVGELIVQYFRFKDIPVLAVSMDGTHLHILAKMGCVPARDFLGNAKKWATHEIKKAGWAGGRLWGKRSLTRPIKNRSHQLCTISYILRHAENEAWIWDFRDHE